MHSFLVFVIVATASKCSRAVWALVRLLTCVLYCMSLQKIPIHTIDNSHHVLDCMHYLHKLVYNHVIQIFVYKMTSKVYDCLTVNQQHALTLKHFGGVIIPDDQRDNVRHMFNLQTYWYNNLQEYTLEIIQISV